jgi:hypothetical protein
MKTTCFLQVEPEFYSWRSDEPKLRSVSVKRVTQKRPRDPISGCVVVRLKLDISDAAFLPLRPEVEVVIPVEHTEAVAVESEPLEVPA